jgi:two-component system, chemotaxis family, protein-glutamate methylesterase/glutaminase
MSKSEVLNREGADELHPPPALLAGLPPDFPLPIAIVQHRSTKHPNMLAKVLGRHCALPVRIASEGEALRPGVVYLAPPELHMTVLADRSFSLADGRKIRHVHSSANPLFESAAGALGGRESAAAAW